MNPIEEAQLLEQHGYDPRYHSLLPNGDVVQLYGNRKPIASVDENAEQIGRAHV